MFNRISHSHLSQCIPDLDPCLDVHCPSFGVCKTYSAHEARCVCDDNCPSYQDPVCSANGTTYDNECLYRLSYCRGLDNNIMYHPGSCEGMCLELFIFHSLQDSFYIFSLLPSFPHSLIHSFTYLFIHSCSLPVLFFHTFLNSSMSTDSKDQQNCFIPSLVNGHLLRCLWFSC